MNKSILQISTDIVEACPYTKHMISAHKLLLAGMISEELSKQRQEGWHAGYMDRAWAKREPDPICQALNEGKGVYKP